MSVSTVIQIMSDNGYRTYLLIGYLTENEVDYAIVSPESPDSDPNTYLAMLVEIIEGMRNFYPLPTDISQRLVDLYLASSQLFVPSSELN